MNKAKKVLVIGLDGMSPKLTYCLIKEGILPSMEKLMKEGVFAKVIPSAPAFTPTNWTTVSTGAWPGTHGIFTWGTHKEGEPLPERHFNEAMSSNICKAEYFWEAAARSGRKSLLVNYIGYPPTSDNVIHAGWFYQPNDYCFEIAPGDAYRNFDLNENVKKLEFKPAKQWKNLPISKRPVLEADLEVKPKENGKGVKYSLLLLESEGKGYDKILLYKSKDTAKVLDTLKEGKWTRWHREKFIVGSKEKIGTVRFKLIELSPDGQKVWLYRSQVYPLAGFIFPAEREEELIKVCGPYINEDVWRIYYQGGVDEATCIEEFSYQSKWIGKTVDYLIKNAGVSIYFQQFHLLDHVGHAFMDHIDSEAEGYDPIKEEKGWQEIRLAYKITDLMVGEVIRAADEDTLVVIISDHGMPVNKKAVSLFNLFRRKGWVEVKQNSEGEVVYDWTKTKAYVTGFNMYVFVNLKGRDPQGIVEPGEEYEKLREEIIDVLLELKDPADGQRVISVALKKEEAWWMGLWGEGVGDVIFQYAPGCRWTGEEVINLGEERIIWPSPGANHGCQPPTTEFNISSNYATLIMTGPGVKKGYLRPDNSVAPLNMVDIAPTIAYLMDLRAPAQSEGKVAYDIIEGKGAVYQRKPKLLKLPVRKEKKKVQVKLMGDVTDEER